ncbi:delphilin-like isoform X3 [Mya arenaria]|uniref:delphilin-like isoform X3 n=1 Tax=Mya arenaria TaxID=6604 RepID=UPI0022E0F3DD|nr:delphilin-like isoform X3 [Mya arenaria]
MGEMLTLNSAHNFGIYTKSGKRTIFQIDFSDRKISLIERGKIGKCYDFRFLEQYDSEDNLHIVLRFRGNKSLEFDADTAEEKYTICRLLGMILSGETFDANGGDAGEAAIQARLSTKRQIVKEGIIEKKGNTKIPTWSRRRLQVCPGEFSYYKPGVDTALNLVQLWENSTTLTLNGQSGFSVSVRDRAYHFKVIGEKGVNAEEERKRWIVAFQQASQRKRATFLLLEMKNQNQNRQGGILPQNSTDDSFEDPGYYNQGGGRGTGSSSGSNSSREVLDGLERGKYGLKAINELDEVLNGESSGGSRQTIALSVVQKTSPLLNAPTKTRARPPVLNTRNAQQTESFESHDTYDFIPEPDYSPPASPTQNDVTSGTDSLQREKQASGVYKNHITPRNSAQDDGVDLDPRTSGIYTRVIRPDSKKNSTPNRASGEYNKAIRPAPGAVNVMPNVGEIPKLKRLGSKENSFESDKTSPRANDSPRSEDNTYDNVTSLSVKQMQEQFEQPYVFENKTPSKPLSPREKKQAPPVPTGNRPVPPPPAPCAPTAPAPPPPLVFGGKPMGKGHLKQVHWNRTPKPMVPNSIWERSRDLTSRLNLALLEDQFALKERDAPITPGPKSPGFGGQKPQLLVDPKRATILDIFMSGLKNGGTRRLVDILSSVSEDDNFPAEKLATIRRYQPNDEEIDMYKAHAHRKHELHPVDQFLLELCEIPCLSIRIDICLILWEFPWQYDSTCQLLDQVHGACDELLNNDMLVAILEYILAIGNHLNRNWSESNVTQGFQITSLDKVLGVRGKDSGYTLVHFLIQQLQQTDRALLAWPETLQGVKKCAEVSVKSVSAEIEVLKGDLGKVKRHLKVMRSQAAFQNRQDSKFLQDAQNVSVEYEMKLEKLDRRSGELQNKYRKILARFGEPLYQRSDQMFAVIASFMDKFKSAMKDLDGKGSDCRKKSTS